MHPFTNILLLRRQWLVYMTGAAKQEIKHPVNVCYSRCFINCEYVVARDPNRWQRLQVLPGHHSHQIDTIAQKSHVIRPAARGLPWMPTCPRRRNFSLTGGGWLVVRGCPQADSDASASIICRVNAIVCCCFPLLLRLTRQSTVLSRDALCIVRYLL